MFFFLGGDKRLENDEPLFLSSSSSDEDDESEGNNSKRQLQAEIIQQVECMSISSDRGAFNPRKRHAAGHTPFDLAKCQKVRCTTDFAIMVYMWVIE